MMMVVGVRKKKEKKRKENSISLQRAGIFSLVIFVNLQKKKRERESRRLCAVSADDGLHEIKFSREKKRKKRKKSVE